MVGADGMARAPPIAPMRQPRHHGADGEGGGARLYGSGALPHSREKRERTRLLQRSGAARCAVWSDGMEHHGEEDDRLTG